MVRKLALQEAHRYRVFRECHPFQGYRVYRFVRVGHQRRVLQGSHVLQEYQMVLNFAKYENLVNRCNIFYIASDQYRDDIVCFYLKYT